MADKEHPRGECARIALQNPHSTIKLDSTAGACSALWAISDRMKSGRSERELRGQPDGTGLQECMAPLDAFECGFPRGKARVIGVVFLGIQPCKNTIEHLDRIDIDAKVQRSWPVATLLRPCLECVDRVGRRLPLRAQ